MSEKESNWNDWPKCDIHTDMPLDLNEKCPKCDQDSVLEVDCTCGENQYYCATCNVIVCDSCPHEHRENWANQEISPVTDIVIEILDYLSKKTIENRDVNHSFARGVVHTCEELTGIIRKHFPREDDS